MADHFDMTICDEGKAFSNPEKLIPFYSTKMYGQGIGLALCRQIIEANHGYMPIAKRQDSNGCCANIEAPTIIATYRHSPP